MAEMSGTYSHGWPTFRLEEFGTSHCSKPLVRCPSRDREGAVSNRTLPPRRFIPHSRQNRYEIGLRPSTFLRELLTQIFTRFTILSSLRIFSLLTNRNGGEKG